MAGWYIDDLAIIIAETPTIETILTLEAWEDQYAYASCPWVYTWDGEEYVKDNDVYSTATKIKDLMENEQTKAIMIQHLSKMIENPMFGMAQEMCINDLSQMASDIFTDKFLYVLNKELTQIKK